MLTGRWDSMRRDISYLTFCILSSLAKTGHTIQYHTASGIHGCVCGTVYLDAYLDTGTLTLDAAVTRL